MKYFLYLFILIGAFAVFLPSISACSCMVPPPPQTALQESDAVFAGEVTEIEEGDIQGTRVVTFTVSQRWKGPESSTLVVTTPDNSAACGFEFVEDEDYLVYASTPDEEDMLSTGLCTRTALLAQAQDDVAALNNAQTPQEPSTPEEEKNNYGMTSFIIIGIIVVVLLIIFIAVRKK